MRRVLIWIGWALSMPGFVAALGMGVVLADLPEAAGCVADRMFSVRCPDTLVGNSLRDLYDVGMIALLTLPPSLLLPLYAFGFAMFRLMARTAAAGAGP